MFKCSHNRFVNLGRFAFFVLRIFFGSDSAVTVNSLVV